MTADNPTVPAADIDHVVENALWVAHANQVGPGKQPARRFMDVFESQASTHWNELLKLHQSETETVEDRTVQTELGVSG